MHLHLCLPIPFLSKYISFDGSVSAGKSILHDMFVSDHVTGICAFVFHCSAECLHTTCSLHGLDDHVTCCSKVWDVRLCLLYHIINGDCFAQRCKASHPCPNRSGCLCIAGAFSLSLSITSFVQKVLKQATPVQMMGEWLLDVVDVESAESDRQRK